MHPVTWQVHQGLQAATALRHAWRSLYEEVPAATPFSSPEWALSWLRHYVRTEAAVIITAHRGGQLLALAPLYRHRTGPVRLLGLAGEGISDYLDVLAHPEADAAVTEALAAGLRGVPRWDVLALRQLPHDGMGIRLLDTWSGGARKSPDVSCGVLRVGPETTLRDLAASRRASSLAKIDQKQRRAIAYGLCHQVTKQVAAADVRNLIDVHRRRWSGRGISPEHESGRFTRHLEEAVPALAELDEAVLYELRSPEALVAARLLLARPGWLGDYLYGMEPAAMATPGLDLNVALMASAMEIALDRTVTTFDFLRGDYPHKQMWAPTRVDTVQGELGRGTLTWWLYRALAGLRRVPRALLARLARRRIAVA